MPFSVAGRPFRTSIRTKGMSLSPSCTAGPSLSVHVVGLDATTIEFVFETHSTTEDNEGGVATGWRAGKCPPTVDVTRHARRGHPGAGAACPATPCLPVSPVVRAPATARPLSPGRDNRALRGTSGGCSCRRCSPRRAYNRAVPEAVIFDLFDTLVDYDDARSRQFSAAAAELLGRERDEFHRVWREGRPIRDTGPLAAYLAQLGIDGEDAQRLVALRRSWSRDLLSTPRVGAIETLLELRRHGIRTGLITVCSEDTVDVWPETPFGPFSIRPYSRVLSAIASPIRGSTCSPASS